MLFLRDICKSNHPIYPIYAILFPIIIILVTVYDYFLSLGDHMIVLFTIKPIPVFLMVMCGIAYMKIYKIHIYAELMTLGLLMCLIGDIFMMLYYPPLFDDLKMILFGSIAFSIARVCMIIAIITYPYSINSKRFIATTPWRLILCGIPSAGYFAGCVFILVTNNLDNLMTGLITTYLFLVTVQMFFASLRVKSFAIESLKSQLFGLFGTLFFTVSDSLLLYDMFISSIPIGHIISMTFYWVGMYLLTISMVRNDNYDIEKMGEEQYLLVDGL